MNIVKHDIDSLNAVIKVHLTKADYEGKVEEALKNARKNIQMPGFRKGMVPAGLVKKMHGKHILIDEINKMVVDGLFTHIEEQKLPILGEPLPNIEQMGKVNWETQSDYEFHYDIALQPKVELKIDKKTKAPYYLIDVDNSFIDKQVDAMASRFGTNVEVDVIENEELVTATFTELDENGNVLENGYVKEGAMLLLKVIPEADRSLFIGKKVGDSITFNPISVIKHEYEVMSMLGVKHEDTRQLNATYKVDILDIKSFKKAEINQDLFDASFGEGEVKSEEEYRNKIKENLQQRFAINSDYKFLADFRKQLLETAALELPEAFLKRWLVAANSDRNISPEEIEKDLPHFFEDLKWQLVKGFFIKENNMVVTEEEFKTAAREFARMQFQQFGYYNPGDEDLDRWAVEISKNKEEAKRIYDIETDKKLIAFFKETIKLEEKTVSFDEFNAMVEQ